MLRFMFFEKTCMTFVTMKGILDSTHPTQSTPFTMMNVEFGPQHTFVTIRTAKHELLIHASDGG